MAGPLAGLTATQIAQNGPQQGAQELAKQNPSKFDQAMKSQGTHGAEHAHQAHGVAQAQKVDVARQIEQVGKTEKAHLNEVNGATDNKLTDQGADPVAQKAEVGKGSDMLMGMMSSMERGQSSLDKLIAGGVSGKSFSNSELLALQAGMYKYTQELELTGKVVEKATSGLKDTLKTQV